MHSSPAVPARSLTRNVSWTLAGNATYAVCQWTVLVSFAKFGTSEQLGQYALGLAVTAPVFQFCSLQLRAVQVTDARNRFAFCDLAGLRLLTTAFGLVIVGALALWGRYSAETGLVVVLIGVSKVFEALSDLCQGLFQKSERMDLVAKSLIIKGVLGALVVAVTLRLSGGASTAAGAFALAGALVWGCYDVRNAAKQLAPRGPYSLLPQLNGPVFRELFLVTLPLGFVMMLISVNSNISRYFLDKYSGVASVGVFSALMYCVIAGNLVMGALGQTASPRFAKLYCDGDLRGFCILLAKLLAFGGVTGIVGLVAVEVGGAWVLGKLYRPDYASHVRAFFWLMAAGAIMNLSGMLGVAVTAMQSFKQQVWTQVGCLAIGAAASALLVPPLGILGAAFSVLTVATTGLIGYSVHFAFAISKARVAPRALVTS